MNKINRQSGIAPLAILLILLVLAGIGGGTAYVVNKNKKTVVVESPTLTATPTPEKPKIQTVTVKITAQNSSKQTGEAVLTEVNGKVKVVLNVSGTQSVSVEPAHIHTGACPTPGAVIYPLASVAKGASQTTLDVTLEQLMAQLPLAINVHKSATQAGVYVACGDITLENASDKVVEEKPVVKEFSMTSWLKMVSGKATTGFSLSEIKVKKGDMVKINVTNIAGKHDFNIDEYGIKLVTPLNQEATVQFLADKVGSFKYYCSMPGHRQMGQEGTLTVTE